MWVFENEWCQQSIGDEIWGVPRLYRDIDNK